ncbi:Clostripain family protein [Candidatus Burarchaeum australiense]|nr:Clostripain family protein [Candidatus Burarchaeum australiense]
MNSLNRAHALLSFLFLSSILLFGCCGQIDGLFSAGNETSAGEQPILPGIPGITGGGSGKADWTIIVMLDGDNNIEEPITFDLRKTEMAGSSDKVNIVAQLDRSPQYWTGCGDWSGARRYLIQKSTDAEGECLTTAPLADLGTVDSGDPATLVDFAEWAIDKYPAEHYVLVLEDHGGGWTGMYQDETSGNDVSLPEMRDALKQISAKLGKKLDLVVFDMCLMAQYDVMLDVAPYADYMVASEEVIPGTSMQHGEVLSALMANPQMGAPELAKKYVAEYEKFYAYREDATTLSALDLSKTGELEAAFSAFAGQMKDKAGAKWQEVAAMHTFAEYYAQGMPEAKLFSFGDLDDFASNAQAYALDDAALTSASLALQKAVNNSVIANYRHVKHPRSAGISYYFQPSSLLYLGNQAEKYQLTTAYEGQQAWRDFLSTYYQNAEELLTAPSVGDFTASPTASLVRPLEFTFTITGSNIVGTQWYQAQWEGELLKISRIVGQRSVTRLPDGKLVNGYPSGESKFHGFSTMAEFRVSDGTRSSAATVYQAWPSQDVFVAQGTLQQLNGASCPGTLIFSGSDGHAVQATCVQQNENGGMFATPVLLSDGDIFTPSVIVPYDNQFGTEPGQPLTYSSDSGIFLEWHPLQEGRTYVAVVEAGDVQQQSGSSQPAQFTVSRQPSLNPLVASEMNRRWECGQLDNGLAVERVMTLELGPSICQFSDPATNSSCAFTYSEAGAPHAYLYVDEWRESLKFFISRRNADSFWLFDLAGSVPIICQRSGLGRPSTEVYRELYNSVGDAGADLDTLQTDPAKLVGTWQNSKGVSFSFNADRSFSWTTGVNSLTGTYSANAEEINLVPAGQTQPITFAYLLGTWKLVVTDPAGSETVVYKPGREPAQPAAQQPVPTTPATPTTPPAQPPVAQPTGLTGTWQDAAQGVIVILASDGSYAWMSPYTYEYGTYSTSSNLITFSSMGYTAQYYYELAGNSLRIYNEQVGIMLTRVV